MEINFIEYCKDCVFKPMDVDFTTCLECIKHQDKLQAKDDTIIRETC